MGWGGSFRGGGEGGGAGGGGRSSGVGGVGANEGWQGFVFGSEIIRSFDIGIAKGCGWGGSMGRERGKRRARGGVWKKIS